MQKLRVNKSLAKVIKDAVYKKLKIVQEEKINHLMPKENIVMYEHGMKVEYKDVDQKERATEMKSHGASGLLEFEKIVTSDERLIPDFIETVSEQMAEQLLSSFFETMSQVTSETGNVVNGGDQPISKELILEAYRKIEVGINEDGSVSAPSMVLSPDLADKAEKIQNTQEFQEEFKKIHDEKVKLAREKEALRMKKFRKPKEK